MELALELEIEQAHEMELAQELEMEQEHGIELTLELEMEHEQEDQDLEQRPESDQELKLEQGQKQE